MTQTMEYFGDLITYQADTHEDLIIEFHRSVDGYLDDCKGLGRQPEQSKHNGAPRKQ